MKAKEFLLPTSPLNLFEVKMSPASLKKLTSTIDAKVGIEFEMAFPHIDDDDDDPEFDFDEDAIVYSVQDVVDFFSEGGVNFRIDLVALERDLMQEVDEKRQELMLELWNDEADEFFPTWVKVNVPEEVVSKFVDKEPDLFGEIVPTKEDWDKFIEHETKTQGDYWKEAKEEFIELHIDDEDFLENNILSRLGYDYMTDIFNNFDINWPFFSYTKPNLEESLEDLATSLEEVVGRKVRYSTGYHDLIKDNKSYVIETDSSINGEGGIGLEIVSPPMSIDEMIQDIKIIKKWADEHDAITNKSTGLHINVSVPGYSKSQLDLTKLTLLVGDKYILKKFDRIANNYAASVFDKILLNTTEADQEIFFRNLKGKMNGISAKLFSSDGFGKYSSINPRENWVEFRSPGGNWLDRDNQELEDTIRRFVIALDAAIDPSKYQKEYLKKLTKIFLPSTGSIEDLFVKYTAGTITKSELKKELQKVREKTNKKKFFEKGIIFVEYNEIKKGDWIIEQPIPDSFMYSRACLKRTAEIDSPEKAQNAVLKSMPKSFDAKRIEEITVTEYDGFHMFVIHERGLPFLTNKKYHRATPAQALESFYEQYPQFSSLDLVASRERDVTYRNSNSDLNINGQTVYAVTDYFYNSPPTVAISGDSPEQAKLRAMFYYYIKISEKASVVPLQEFNKDSPDNDETELKLYRITYIEDPYYIYDILATSKKQAAIIHNLLEGEKDGGILITQFPQLDMHRMSYHTKEQIENLMKVGVFFNPENGTLSKYDPNNLTRFRFTYQDKPDSQQMDVFANNIEQAKILVRIKYDLQPSDKLNLETIGH